MSSAIDPVELSQSSEGKDVVHFSERVQEIESEVDFYNDTSDSRKGIYQIIEEYHRFAFAIVLTFEMLAVVISLALWVDQDYLLFPVDFNQVPMVVQADKTYARYGSWSSIPHIGEESEIDFLKNPHISDHLEVMYQGDNVLSKESLNTISSIEKELTDSPEWRSQIKTPAGDLVPMSILMFFNGKIDPVYNDSDFKDIPATLSKAYVSGYDLEINTLVAKDAVISRTVATSTLTRTVFYIARTGNYSSIEFWNKFFADKLDVLVANGRGGLTIYYMNKKILFQRVTEQVNIDFKRIYFSLAFIVIVVYIHTQSIFLTTMGLFGIFASFLWTNLIYRVVLNYTYFGIFHVVSMFIILGIGSDDLFVFYDTWRVALCMNLDETYKKFSFCYRNASLSMLLTSVTTALAFATNFSTPLFAIKSFSIFTSILVMINYVSAITFFPMCVLFYYKDIEPCKWPWSRERASSVTSISDVRMPNIFVRVFRNHIYRLLTHHIFKWILIVFFTAYALYYGWLALHLEVSKTGLQYFSDGHPFEKSRKLEQFGFKQRLIDNKIKVHIVFGKKEQDVSKCEEKYYKCNGTVLSDTALDLNPVDAQQALLDVCHSLERLKLSPDIRLIRDGNGNKVSCFISHMDRFFKKYSQSGAQHTNVTLPITTIKYLSVIKAMPNIYGPKILDGSFYRFFETATKFWLTNGYGLLPNVYVASNYTPYLLNLDPAGADYVAINNRTDGFGYGHKLMYFIIELQTDIQIGYVDYKEGLTCYYAWENFTNTMMAKLPPSVQGFQVATKMEWHYFIVAENLMYNVKRGIILGSILAFVVLMVSTGNVIISLLATINILFVVTTFAGVIKSIGWSISVIESINLALVTGMAVDFVVHLSGSYHHAPHDTRSEKIRDTMELMCTPILFGCITTAGASIIMMPAQIFFYFQFGVFFLATINLSLLYSFFWFLPMMSVFGPVGETGSIQPLLAWIWRVITWLWKIVSDRGHDQKMSYSRSLSLHQKAFDARLLRKDSLWAGKTASMANPEVRRAAGSLIN